MRARYLCVITGAAILALFLCNTAIAANIADKLQRRYAQIETMRADFAQVLMHKESGSREQRSGTLIFKKPLLVRWETQTPSPELLLVGADAIWNTFPDEELVYKYPLSMAEDSRSMVRVVTGQARLDQDFDLEEEGKDGTLLTVRLYPREPAQFMVEALLWIDPGTWLIKKLRVYDFYGNENEISFTRQDIGAAVADSLFRYSPPREFIVEDRTKDAGAAPRKALMQ